MTATTPLNIADAASNPGIEGLIVLALVNARARRRHGIYHIQHQTAAAQKHCLDCADICVIPTRSPVIPAKAGIQRFEIA